MEPPTINVALIHQRVSKELHEAELEVARLRGKLELLEEIIQPSITTEGEDNPS